MLNYVYHKIIKQKLLINTTNTKRHAKNNF